MSTKEEVKQLWRQCFDDSEAFIELYFRLRYSDEVTMTTRANGKLIAALQMLPYTIALLDVPLEAAYISGACTHPDSRGKGVMGHLLADSFREMANRHISLSFLIPATDPLYHYYARYGYASVFYREHHQVTLSAMDEVSDEALTVDHITMLEDEWFDYYTRCMNKRTNCVLHNYSDMQGIVEDLALAQGTVAIARNTRRQIVGLAFTAPSLRSVRVLDYLVDSTEATQVLFNEICRFHRRNELTYTTPSTDAGTDVCMGMLRIVDAPKVCRHYAQTYPENQMEFLLTDNELPENNGYYSIRKGECQFMPSLQKENIPVLTIAELSERLFRQDKLYMSLMLD